MKLKCIRHLQEVWTKEPYLIRWNLFDIFGFSAKIHLFLSSDEDRALHSHPFWFGGMLISGRYKEVTDKGVFIRKPFRPYFHNPNYFHRVELFKYDENDEDAQGSVLKPVLTLFITWVGFKKKSWNFKCPAGLKDYKEFHKDGGC